ncbi:unnamed protein product [Amoebophrya sp. A25]|nr:unnamed protein product [Amoebophrya sp. A25]|eukprot:GSA25T00012100001.1
MFGIVQLDDWKHDPPGHVEMTWRSFENYYLLNIRNATSLVAYLPHPNRTELSTGAAGAGRTREASLTSTLVYRPQILIDEEYFQLRTVLRALHDWLTSGEYLHRPFTYAEWGASCGPWTVRVAKLVQYWTKRLMFEKGENSNERYLRTRDHSQSRLDDQEIYSKNTSDKMNHGRRRTRYLPPYLARLEEQGLSPCRLLVLEPSLGGVATALENLALNDVRCESVVVWQGYIGGVVRPKKIDPRDRGNEESEARGHQVRKDPREETNYNARRSDEEGLHQYQADETISDDRTTALNEGLTTVGSERAEPTPLVQPASWVGAQMIPDGVASLRVRRQQHEGSLQHVQQDEALLGVENASLSSAAAALSSSRRSRQTTSPLCGDYEDDETDPHDDESSKTVPPKTGAAASTTRTERGRDETTSGTHIEGGDVEDQRLLFSRLLRPEDVGIVDLIDMDIQGQEARVAPLFLEEFAQRVRRVHIGTHGKSIHKTVKSLFLGQLDASPPSDAVEASEQAESKRDLQDYRPQPVWSVDQDYLSLTARRVEHYGNVLFRDGVFSASNRLLSPWKDTSTS